jgi:hypothetical protein
MVVVGECNALALIEPISSECNGEIKAKAGKSS